MKNKKVMNKQTGFTLIELVIVIVILGVLSAVALPKFVDLGSDAKAGVMESVEGSMRSTNAMIYAKAAINGVVNINDGEASVAIGTENVVTTYGYASTPEELIKAMDIGDKFTTLNANNDIRYTDSVTPENCSVTYSAASATVAPTYNTATTGC